MSENVPKRINYRCPSCGHQTIAIDNVGWLICTWLPCKAPAELHDRIEAALQPSPDRDTALTALIAEWREQADAIDKAMGQHPVYSERTRHLLEVESALRRAHADQVEALLSGSIPTRETQQQG